MFIWVLSLRVGVGVLSSKVARVRVRVRTARVARSRRGRVKKRGREVGIGCIG